MTVPVFASDLAIGDYSPVYGTVTAIKEHRDRKTNELKNVDISFFNGTNQPNIEPDAIYEMVQGFKNDHMPLLSNIRPNLAADHANKQ